MPAVGCLEPQWVILFSKHFSRLFIAAGPLHANNAHSVHEGNLLSASTHITLCLLSLWHGGMELVVESRCLNNDTDLKGSCCNKSNPSIPGISGWSSFTHQWANPMLTMSTHYKTKCFFPYYWLWHCSLLQTMTKKCIFCKFWPNFFTTTTFKTNNSVGISLQGLNPLSLDIKCLQWVFRGI